MPTHYLKCDFCDQFFSSTSKHYIITVEPKHAEAYNDRDRDAHEYVTCENCGGGESRRLRSNSTNRPAKTPS